MVIAEDLDLDVAPNALAASRCALSRAASTSSAERTTRMPLPPPPADALTSSGKPIARAWARSVARA